MPEHQIRSYQKVIGLSIIPLFWGLLSTASIRVSADEFPTTSNTDQQSPTKTSANANSQSAPAYSISPAQSGGYGASASTAAAPAASAATEPDPYPAADTEVTSGNGKQAHSDNDAAQDVDSSTQSNNNPNDRSDPNNNANRTDQEPPAAQPSDSTTVTEESAAVADNQTHDQSDLTPSTAAVASGQSENDASLTAETLAANATDNSSNQFTNPSENNVAETPTQTQLASFRALVNQYLTTYNNANQTTYQLLPASSTAVDLEADLFDPQMTNDQQAILSGLTRLLDNFIADNRLNLLKTYRGAGTNLTFDLTTGNNTHLTIGKTLVLSIYVVKTDETGNPIGPTVPVSNAANTGLRYGGSWSTSPSDINGYRLVQTPANASGTWNDTFDYGLLNNQGELILKYVYKKVPVIVPPEPTPTPAPASDQAETIQPAMVEPAPLTPVASVEPTVPQPSGPVMQISLPSAPLTDQIQPTGSQKIVKPGPFTLATTPKPVLASGHFTARPTAYHYSVTRKVSKQPTPTVQPVTIPSKLTPIQRLSLNFEMANQKKQPKDQLATPVITTNHQMTKHPSGGPIHTQLGLYFATLSGTINFGTTANEEAHLDNPFI